MNMDTSETIHWRLRRGLGKANRELARLTRENRKHKQPNYIFVISREEIEGGDFSGLRSEFSLDSPPDKLRALVGGITFAITDYEDTREELFEIPEVRGYFSEVNCHWPCWTAFATLDSGMLGVITACIADHLTALKQKGRRSYDLRIPRNELLRCFMNSVPLTSAVYRTAGFTPRQIRKQLAAVARHLGLM